MKMVRKFDTFMGDGNAFRYWLFRIACNEVNSYFRRAGRQARAYEKLQQEHIPETEDASADVADKEDNAKKLAFLKQAISTLKPVHQDIISLRFFKSLNSAQIGEVLDMKPATVRSQLARALNKLKQKYKIHQQQAPKGLCWYE